MDVYTGVVRVTRTHGVFETKYDGMSSPIDNYCLLRFRRRRPR